MVGYKQSTSVHPTIKLGYLKSSQQTHFHFKLTCLSNTSYSFLSRLLYSIVPFLILINLGRVGYCTREHLFFYLLSSEIYSRTLNLTSFKVAPITSSQPQRISVDNLKQLGPPALGKQPLSNKGNFPQKGRSKTSWNH